MDDRLEELKDIEVQRTDIVTKLGKIEDKKHTVSAEVYEKVKSEYEDKLKTLDDRMTEHIDLIKEQVQEIEQEEHAILESEKEIKIHLEELELRFSIGEYSEDDYKSKKDEYEIKLKAGSDKKNSLDERKSWLGNFINLKDAEQTLAQDTEPSPEVEPILEEKIEELSEEELEPIAENKSEDVKKPELEPIEEAPAEKSTDGIEIEEHILEEKLPDEETKLDELIVEEETIPPTPIESQTENLPTEEEKPEETAPKQTTEKDKAIACPKCNHLNTPDSWYCEKCGAEILDTPIS